MTDKKPTYEELLEWHDEEKKNFKITEVLKSFIVCCLMMIVFMVIELFARIGAAEVFETIKLAPEAIKLCDAFIQIGITFVYVYMAWHFFMMVMFIYKEDINKFCDKWKAFKAWYKKEKELAPKEVTNEKPI